MTTASSAGAPPPRSIWFETSDPIRTDDALPSAADVVVVGAGLTGIATALMLARRGRRAVVVEARTIGAATTGHTTGKLSLLQGDVLSELRSRSGEAAMRAYVAGNRAAQDWVVLEAGDDRDIMQQTTSYTYSTTPEGDELIASEADALAAAGLTAHRTQAGAMERLGLPFPVTSGLAMDNQWQLHSLRLLGRLVARLREAGGTVVEGCRVTGANLVENGVHVETDRGVIRSAALVIATGTPILDRGLFFAKLAPLRSLVGAYALDPEAALPRGVYLSVDPRARSLRTAVDKAGRRVLLVGSQSFTTGREDSTTELLAELDAWTAENFGPSRRVTWWGAQDYRSLNRLPYAGELPRGGGRIYVATGYNKWGMTNAIASALTISGAIAGETPTWAQELDAARPVLKAGGEAVTVNAEVAGELVAGWARAETGSSARKAAPEEGEGHVGHAGVQPVAVATVDGVTCRVSGVCTHLGGVLSWNDAERSWDCPLHGSRFDVEGRVLEGPAVKDLTRL